MPDMKLRATAENVTTQNKIMPSTAKQTETTAFESVRDKLFTRVHGRPTTKSSKRRPVLQRAKWKT
jgi:hypothetical protein